MARFIHARRRDGEIMYREWCNSMDEYVTEPMTGTECIDYLMRDTYAYSRGDIESGGALHDIKGRMARARKHGTSARPDAYWSKSKDPLSDPWDTEKCRHCGCFHHVYEANCCDDPEDSIGHKPKCEGT